MTMLSKFSNFPDELKENDKLKENELSGSDCITLYLLVSKEKNYWPEAIFTGHGIMQSVSLQNPSNLLIIIPIWTKPSTKNVRLFPQVGSASKNLNYEYI